MYRPQLKENRYLIAYLMKEYHDEINIISTRYEYVYDPQSGELLATLPLMDIVFK